MSAIEFDLTDAGVCAEFHAGQLTVRGLQIGLPFVLASDEQYHRVWFDVPLDHAQRDYISAVHFIDTTWRKHDVPVVIAGAMVSTRFWWEQVEKLPGGVMRYSLKAVRA